MNNIILMSDVLWTEECVWNWSYIGLLFSLINQDLLVYVRQKFYWFNIVFKTYSDGNFLS